MAISVASFSKIISNDTLTKNLQGTSDTTNDFISEVSILPGIDVQRLKQHDNIIRSECIKLYDSTIDERNSQYSLFPNSTDHTEKLSSTISGQDSINTKEQTVESTKEQNRILRADPNQNLCINASPGAGKTTTIIMRLVYITRYYNIPLSQICMLTYNKFLAKDMIKKLKHYGINHKDLGWCGTLHALCYRDTKKFGTLTPWINKFKDISNVYPQYKYIIFDEYQDADENIATVVEILSRNKFLTIVGDERQSIYQYRGANANLLLDLRQNYIKYPLSRTFRCNINICKLLTRLYPSYPPIRSKVKGPRPKLYRKHSNYMNDPDIIEQIVRIVNESKMGNIAIISPIVNTDKSSSFLNDIHSNISQRCGIHFECNIGDMRDLDIDNDNVENNIITSIHGVKGREYHTVIFLNVVDADYSFEYPNSEALSKLFVGLSRARYNLHVFENLYSNSVGSLQWITDNEDLFDHVKGWNYSPRSKLSNTFNKNPRRKCTDFVRSLSPAQRDHILQDYHDEELVGTETGIGSHYGNPILFGMLIEILLSIKIRGVIPSFEFKIYITNDEWKRILRNESLYWLDSKINMVFPFPVRKILMGSSVNIINNEGQFITEINDQNIVSSLIHKEYYNYLPTAQALSSELTNSIDEDNINKIWWIVRFLRLTQLSLIGFNKPDLKSNEIYNIINYINGSNILNNLHINRYHHCVQGEIQILSSDTPTVVVGEIDFESDDALVEIKCYSSRRSFEDAWLQTIIYNFLLPIDNSRQSTFRNIASKRNVISNDIIINYSSASNNSPEYLYKTLYIYNPISGELWRRSLKI
jgi:hypothetical protein